MAKKPAKKTAPKSAAGGLKKTAAKKNSKKSDGSAAKKSTAKTGKKVPVKKPITEKEREQREANLIANSEKKKIVRQKIRKAERPEKLQSKKEESALLEAVIEGMQEKKAKNITVLNLSNIENRVCDYFVICDADSKTHVASIADSVEEVVLKKTSEKPYHSEGYENSEWILVDYINIVAHVFLREVREHYNIEALWGDAEMTLIN